MPNTAPDDALPRIVVAAGIIRDGCGHLCLSRRPPHKHQGGLWEFPGGKVEEGEAVADALARELHEELGIDVAASAPFMTVIHQYPELCVTLHFRDVTHWQGEPRGREGQPVEWVPLSALSGRAFPAANQPVATALHLPPELVIVPEDLDETAVLAGLERLDAAHQGVYLRGWSQSPALPRLAARCRQLGLRFWVRDDADLATREGAFGLHLGTAALASMATLADAPAFDGVLSAACHDDDQLRQARALGCDMVLLSPVAATPTHPDARPLGWAGFREILYGQPLAGYALGGVGPDDLAWAREQGGFGVAGIRAFWPD